MPFVVTLATFYVGRGLALWITQTRAMNLPESFLQLGAVKLAGVPLPIAIFAVLLDSARSEMLARLGRRRIRIEDAA